MMIQKELMRLGIEETGCHLTDTPHDIEIKTAQDIGLIDQILTGIRVIGKDSDILSTRKPCKEIRSGIRHYHHNILSLTPEVTTKSQRRAYGITIRAHVGQYNVTVCPSHPDAELGYVNTG
jgi:hypothetical protein